MTDLPALLQRLVEAGVDFILVGGAAATAHGSSRLTQDVDVVYSRSASNIARLVAGVAPLNPYLRGAPPGLPFRWDQATVTRGLNFTLNTSLGPLDLFGEIAGGGTYENLLPDSADLRIFGVQCRCLNLEALIKAKRAAGRPRDLESIAELEAIREELSGQ